MRFFDTNVLVYAQDPSDAVKRLQARHLIESAIAESAFMLSTQVLVEFYAVSVRKKLLSPAAALALVKVWAEHEIVPATSSLLVRAFTLHQAHRLSVWDALIVQAALEAGCSTLYSEDLHHGMRFEGVTVVNPFLNPPTAVHEPVAAYGKRRAK